MDVIRGILSEVELKLFEAGDFECLQKLLNDSLASQIKTYVTSSGQDPEVLDKVNLFLIPFVEDLTFPQFLRENGYVDLVRQVSPSVIVSTEQDINYLNKVHDKLSFLEENYHRIQLTTSSRKKEDYDNFCARMRDLVNRARIQGIPLHYPELVQRIEANRFVFYNPKDKGHPTQLSILINKHKEWLLCLRGLDYKKYCDSHNIPKEVRRAF